MTETEFTVCAECGAAAEVRQRTRLACWDDEGETELAHIQTLCVNRHVLTIPEDPEDPTMRGTTRP